MGTPYRDTFSVFGYLRFKVINYCRAHPQIPLFTASPFSHLIEMNVSLLFYPRER